MTTNPVPFGWCFGDDAEHANCRVEYIDWNGKERKCSCKNHTKAPPVRKQRVIKIKRTKRETQ